MNRWGNQSIPVKDESVKTKIFVCFHKPYPVSNEEIYLPIHGGKENAKRDLGILGDNTGDNISRRNTSFCELSVMYWAWKNTKQVYPNIEYIGFCHYRRYLALDKNGESIPLGKIPEMNNYGQIIETELKQHDFILPNKTELQYTIRTHYELDHNYKDWVVLKKVVGEIYPGYKETFEKHLEEENIFIACNMFITRWDTFEKYCVWLFDILFEAERRINIEDYNSYQKRMLGFMSERLLTLYIFHNKFRVSYKPVYHIWDKITILDKIRLNKIIRKIIIFFIPYGIIKIIKERK